VPEEPPIPVEVDDVTPEWLSNVLEVEVRAVEVLEARARAVANAIDVAGRPRGLGPLLDFTRLEVGVHARTRRRDGIDRL